MTAIEQDVAHASFWKSRAPRGPITAARQRRTTIVYATVFLLGLLPLVIGASPAWQAIGLGLWLPGGGFVAVGGWTILLFPLTLALFVASLVAWFWAGMVIAPITVWLGAAMLAGAMTGESIWPGSYLVVAASMTAVAYAFYRRSEKRRVKGEKRFAARSAFLPNSLAEVTIRAAATPDPTKREMSAEDLASLRYVLDRALQPVDQFNGFDIIDQFQPAALRYQLNHMGFALGLVQGAYVPNFSGYFGEAQRNLISKYLLRRVWSYWVYESCWGHLNVTNFDPANHDNIMLTGWLGMHVGQYMLNSGDRRYAEPGSLTFRLNSRTAYPHNYQSIINSVTQNYASYESQFCLYPCEPNWIYPICNHYGMTALATHDRLFGSNYVGRFLPKWLEKLDTEFTGPSGSIIGLRSQHLGFEVPFPVGESGYANFADCFAPERGRRLWAIARKEIEPAIVKDAEGRARLRFPGKGLDAGNYSSGHTAAYASFLSAAHEFGDNEIADAAQRALDQDCGLSVENGVRRYLKGSNLANTNAVMGRLIRTGDFRRSFVEGPAPATLAGPVLSACKYPDVLVARAFSHGEDLNLVLHPGAAAGEQQIKIERLKAGRRYDVRGASEATITADQNGHASLSVKLAGRTEISIQPA
jgi:hypothetical protein